MDTSTRAAGFGETHFGTAELGDRRRRNRLVRVADLLVQHPGGTLPDKCKRPPDLKALYRLMNQDAVTHASVLASSVAHTTQRMAAVNGVVLIVHDTTELDYSGLSSMPDLGQIGDGHGRGYKCHNSLAVVADTGEVLGLVNQILHRRRRAPRGEQRAQRRRCAERESRLWKQGSAALPPAPSGRLWVEVADCAADITEFLDFADERQKTYVVRSQHDRNIVRENAEKSAECKLHAFARSLPEMGRRCVQVQARPGQTARTATVRIGCSALTIVPPRQPRGEERGALLQVWVVAVCEIDPPHGVESLEWILLTNCPVESFEEAGRVIDWYTRRWIIEEYHKALKTGCGIETLQFTSEDRLQPAIALLSVVALSLLQLRDASRSPQAHTQPASELFTELFVSVLSRWRHGDQQPEMSVHDFCYALARLGGHQNRKHDRPPGWLVLWRGWTKLQLMTEAISIMASKTCGQT
jgi:hypothetical protein